MIFFVILIIIVVIVGACKNMNKNGFLFLVALCLEKVHHSINPFKDLSSLRDNPRELYNGIMNALDSKRINPISAKSIKSEIKFWVKNCRVPEGTYIPLSEKAVSKKVMNVHEAASLITQKAIDWQTAFINQVEHNLLKKSPVKSVDKYPITLSTIKKPTTSYRETPALLVKTWNSSIALNTQLPRI